MLLIRLLKNLIKENKISLKNQKKFFIEFSNLKILKIIISEKIDELLLKIDNSNKYKIKLYDSNNLENLVEIIGFYLSEFLNLEELSIDIHFNNLSYFKYFVTCPPKLKKLKINYFNPLLNSILLQNLDELFIKYFDDNGINSINIVKYFNNNSIFINNLIINRGNISLDTIYNFSKLKNIKNMNLILDDDDLDDNACKLCIKKYILDIISFNAPKQIKYELINAIYTNIYPFTEIYNILKKQNQLVVVYPMNESKKIIN